ncbi:MAG TPA: hypothetical protein DCF45_09760 [Gammaproteobacteria bacterium]|nr:hypothetical protein [Gammaproteobacteria bacterium]
MVTVTGYGALKMPLWLRGSLHQSGSGLDRGLENIGLAYPDWCRAGFSTDPFGVFLIRSVPPAAKN